MKGIEWLDEVLSAKQAPKKQVKKGQKLPPDLAQALRAQRIKDRFNERLSQIYGRHRK